MLGLSVSTGEAPLTQRRPSPPTPLPFNEGRGVRCWFHSLALRIRERVARERRVRVAFGPDVNRPMPSPVS